MLIKCPECELQISDKAISCPHCGYPIQPNIIQKKIRNSNKRKRLPNGFGQISEIKNRNLRNRFRAMVTIGKTDAGRPICKPLKPESFFPTYNDAYSALVEYNKNPYDLSPALTLKELYDKWIVEYKTKIGPSNYRTIKNAWDYCHSIHKMRVIDIRAYHIKKCMEEGTAIRKGVECHTTADLKARIKSMFNLMLDYAVEYEIADKNYARTFSVSDDVRKDIEKNKRNHIPFTEEEIQKLWDNVDKVKNVDLFLIQCYSGWRPQELGLIELKNVDLENWTFIGGMKTEAGTNRIVPIHTKIRDLVKNRYNESKALNSEYLFTYTDELKLNIDNLYTYERILTKFNKIKDVLKLNPEHRPHDGRVHFITQAKKYKVDEFAIKYIVGHAINDITEKVYTKREFDWLKTEIEKIK